MEPEDFCVEWTSNEVVDNTFKGVVFVLGRGDLYVLITEDTKLVTAFDVYRYGTHVGYYDFEAVDIVAKDIEYGKHAFYVILKYGEQYFGPYFVNVNVLRVCLLATILYQSTGTGRIYYT